MEKNIENLEKFQEIADLLKVIAHPVRLCIVNGLLDQGTCNVSFIQNCLDTPQSTISQHLQRLRNAGIVKGKREGTEIYYSIANKKIALLVKELLNESEV